METITKKKKAINRPFFAVVAKGHEHTHCVLLLADTKKQAIRLWENWNPHTTFTESKKKGWYVQPYTAKYNG